MLPRSIVELPTTVCSLVNTPSRGCPYSSRACSGMQRGPTGEPMTNARPKRFRGRGYRLFEELDTNAGGLCVRAAGGALAGRPDLRAEVCGARCAVCRPARRVRGRVGVHSACRPTPACGDGTHRRGVARPDSGALLNRDETGRAVEEIARVLKPGGRAIVGVSNRYDRQLRFVVIDTDTASRGGPPTRPAAHCYAKVSAMGRGRPIWKPCA